MSSQHRHSSARSVLLHERARVMRAQPMLSEARVWAQLSGRKLGVAFRRQVVLGEYIVDFLAPDCRLVVEVDGAYHARRLRADDRRDARIRALGFRVLYLDAQFVTPDLLVTLGLIRGGLGATREQ
jgi:very-short-patch-repair endonuclease